MDADILLSLELLTANGIIFALIAHDHTVHNVPLAIKLANADLGITGLSVLTPP